MVTPEDTFLAISNSGETDEMVKLIPFLKDNRNLLISMTGPLRRRCHEIQIITWTLAWSQKLVLCVWRRLRRPLRPWQWGMRSL